MNRYSPHYDMDSSDMSMSINEQGSWVHITEVEKLQRDVIHWREARRSCIEAGDMMKAEIERLRDLLRAAPCTCPNPFPGDWPHDPENEECYLNLVRRELGDG